MSPKISIPRFSLMLAVLFLFVRPLAAVVHDRLEIAIPMRDGQNLIADRHLPPGEGPWPVVLIQTPYLKSTFWPVLQFDVSRNPLFKSPDYAFVIMDWRGFGESAGTAYAGSPTRGEDGFDAVEWVAAQPWCDGNIGTWGASALGIVQIQTALEQPSHLKACVPMVCRLGETYEMWFPGGVYYENRNAFVESYFAVGDTYRNHPTYDTFWEFVEGLAPSIEEIETPMLFVSGWYDHEPAITIDLFQNIRAAQLARGLDHTRMMIGPWSHGGLGKDKQGELSYEDAEFADSLAALSFFDQHLRGLAPPAQAQTTPFRYYQINESRWLDSGLWPPESFSPRTWYLRDDGSLSFLASPDPEATLAYVSNPLNAVPTIFGAVLTDDGGQTQGPGDVSALIGRADTLLFQSPVLSQPLVLAGSARATLHLETDAPDVDVMVRLLHLTPDGRANIIVDGARRASFRNGFTAREFLEDDVPVEVSVGMPPVAITIPAGHRGGILVCSTNHDLFSINPQDGNDFLDDPGAAPASATISLHLSSTLPSRIDLPVQSESTLWLAW